METLHRRQSCPTRQQVHFYSLPPRPAGPSMAQFSQGSLWPFPLGATSCKSRGTSPASLLPCILPTSL